MLFDRVLKIVRFAWVSKLTVSCLTGYLGCWVLFAWVFRFGLTGYHNSMLLFDRVSGLLPADTQSNGQIAGYNDV